ncbi:hypothetical protein SAMN05421678_101318 [Actinopolymorpha cephalotaxi]|uniref:Uncharacterized protein n=1 Tax=Actinopolymorpha cephalotaxi TaxID=504797 RepID=A0A1I2KML3_9ACTN|nr:hypothetical protein [Actinopolymorpha cephalotaxi]NYH84460.1 hypothetical protein [Actinopolymorpha cephalotaxi]SFF66467.1 hypothetical protein SAMN05421678_101318 [Actinopolymorpha cephalotaxi]
MRDVVLTAVVCGGAVLCVPYLRTVLAEAVHTGRWSPGIDQEWLLAVVVPVSCGTAAALVLWAMRTDRPVLAPLVAGTAVLVVHVALARTLFLLAGALGLTPGCALATFAALVGGWAGWAGASGRPWPPRVAGLMVLAGLGVVAVVEHVFADRLDVAVKRQEIRATGLRPLLIDDPAWRLDYVYVAPDGRSISVGYDNAAADNSLSVELTPLDHAPVRDLVPAQSERELVPAGAVRPALRRLGGVSSPRYLTRVGSQWVRLEFDHGEVGAAEAARLVAGMRAVDPGELADRDAGAATWWRAARAAAGDGESAGRWFPGLRRRGRVVG